MEHTFLHKLNSALWAAIITVIVAMAVYVSFGRFLMSNVGQYDKDILRLINTRVPFIIEADKVSGRWDSFTPEIVFKGLRLSMPDNSELPIELAEGKLALDVWGSLVSLNVHMSRLQLKQLKLSGELTEEGKFRIAGLDSRGQTFRWLEAFLLNFEYIDVVDNQLALSLPTGDQRILDLNLSLRREGSFRRLEARLKSQTSGATVYALAEGLGNPLKLDTFAGDLYLDMKMADLQSIQPWIPDESRVNVAGELNLEAWVSWTRGAPSLDLAFRGQKLNIAAPDGSWRLPLDFLSLQGSLEGRDDHWTLFASDFELNKDAVSLHIPRLQLDSWGDSIRVRAIDLPLEPINSLLVDSDFTPGGLSKVLEVLQVNGELSSLQFSTADVREPVKDWELSARFEDLEVNPWRGAPGVTGGRGYAELTQAGGTVILDSSQFSLDFTKVYRQPLYFDDLYSRIDIGWGDGAVTLSSGLLTGTAEEGSLQVVFGLNIPLKPNNVGIEMDLLVGMENLDPAYRAKYIPYTLSTSLLNWLDTSIAQGQIEQGGFLWRGSLLPRSTPLRTVQLFFDISDIRLNYHPDWPPLSELNGIVLIDDTDISVWSERARLYDSLTGQVTAEAWLNERRQIELAIRGSVEGPASDGLRVVNESPLSRISGNVFNQWQAAGALQTELQLWLNLANMAVAPQIDVDTHWQTVDLQINPGNLSVRGINGALSYTSASGFQSSDLTGQLWDKDLAIQVGQLPAAVEEDFDEQTVEPDKVQPSIVEVRLAAQVDIVDIKKWLALGVLDAAQGTSEAQARILLSPGEAPLLTLDSDLVGISLDLPDPWSKPEGQTQRIRLEWPLGGGSNLMKLELTNQLYFHALLADGTLRGGALGFQEAPGTLEPGSFRVTGHAPLVDAQQWWHFAQSVSNGVWPVEVELGSAVSIAVDNLQADTLLLFGQDLWNAVLSLEIEQGWNRMWLETEKIRGHVALTPDLTEAKLELEFLEVTGFKQLNLESGDDEPSLEFPDVEASIKELHYGGRLLGDIAFNLSTHGGVLQADNITGDIMGLKVGLEQPGKLRWLPSADVNRTRVNTSIDFEDLGQTLERLDYQKILETNSGKFSLELSWPGGPQNFALQHTLGSMQVDINEGRFLSAPAGTSGTLKVVSILNLADIVGRLSLMTMFDAGIPFHGVAGELFFQEGSIDVVNIEVEGTSSGFQFTGSADVATKTLEGALVVTLPVASNLPWVVALTAGLPVAAGVYVFSKVFGKQMNRVAAAIYNVSGNWDDPSINFDQIFDTTSHTRRGSQIDSIENGSSEEGPLTGDSLVVEGQAGEKPAEGDMAEDTPVAEDQPNDDPVDDNAPPPAMDERDSLVVEGRPEEMPAEGDMAEDIPVAKDQPKDDPVDDSAPPPAMDERDSLVVEGPPEEMPTEGDIAEDIPVAKDQPKDDPVDDKAPPSATGEGDSLVVEDQPEEMPTEGDMADETSVDKDLPREDSSEALPPGGPSLIRLPRL